ncbi:alkaline phosphatase family protein [Paludibaculum fermentans]|uniref:Alkaline phosphatase family protein n=1 Tax=Paludibaculum fermentans TaxID=1473598 RepID=A0A7S7SIM4_PALFE|nr:ectonucleotide pyrophosphatase/phosphodiesterase [Paludibaculum fermentans]QOY86244.1 alkaline phosphatase family protein [Paludibaculum fermentans]
MWKNLLATALLSTALFAQTADRRVIVISVDGLKAETLRDSAKLGLKIPNLAEMRDKGAVSAGLTGVFPTVTYPSHTTMMTGVQPAEHGILGNNLFDPESRTHGAWYWFSELIKKPTLWDAAKSAGKTVGAVAWPVTVGARIDYNIPEYAVFHGEDSLLLQRSISTPGLYEECEKALGKNTWDAPQTDALRAAQAAYILRTRKPHLMLIHLIDLDHEEHGFGPGSPEAHHALEEIDKAIGSIRAAVREAGIESSTHWVILSDHGFWPVSQAFQPQAFLSSLGLAAPEGKPAEWRVATHANGGSVAFVVKDPKDTEAQQIVMKALATLQANERWGVEHVLDKTQLAERKSYSHAFAAVSMRRGFTVGSNRSGAWITSSGATRGMHGFVPGPAELDCTFLVYGPGIAARALPHGNLADVATTTSVLLGVSLPESKGQDLLKQ